jgi:hypothetical protein
MTTNAFRESRAVLGKFIPQPGLRSDPKPDLTDDVEQKTGADGGVYPAA